MAASRRGQPELHVRLPPSSPSTGAGLTTGTSLAATQQLDLPPVSAVFLIEFDVKAGYTLTWKAAQPGIELEGTVEYKSLPSGAHTVTDDLIYFVHEGYAGLSAFVNAPIQDTESRNARMLAVGVLVPLSYGRLGRAWRHAEGLKEMASKIVVSGKEVSILEQYWEKNRARDESTEQDPQASRESLDSPSVTFQDQPKPPKKQKPITRNRSASDGTGLLAPGHKLSPFHPAWSLTALLDTLGPLIFPIHRAALLRKRILISCHAPVQEICNFGKNILYQYYSYLAVSNSIKCIIFQSSRISHFPHTRFFPRKDLHTVCGLFSIFVSTTFPSWSRMPSRKDPTMKRQTMSRD